MTSPGEVSVTICVTKTTCVHGSSFSRNTEICGTELHSEKSFLWTHSLSLGNPTTSMVCEVDDGPIICLSYRTILYSVSQLVVDWEWLTVHPVEFQW